MSLGTIAIIDCSEACDCLARRQNLWKASLTETMVLQKYICVPKTEPEWKMLERGIRYKTCSMKVDGLRTQVDEFHEAGKLVVDQLDASQVVNDIQSKRQIKKDVLVELVVASSLKDHKDPSIGLYLSAFASLSLSLCLSLADALPHVFVVCSQKKGRGA
jgi:hypothetical protein